MSLGQLHNALSMSELYASNFLRNLPQGSSATEKDLRIREVTEKVIDFEKKVVKMILTSPQCVVPWTDDDIRGISHCFYALPSKDQVAECVSDTNDIRQNLGCNCDGLDHLRNQVTVQSMDKCTDRLCRVGLEGSSSVSDVMEKARAKNKELTDPKLGSECWELTSEVGEILGSSGSNVRLGKGGWLVGVLALSAAFAMN